jgi:hypothetical protein
MSIDWSKPLRTVEGHYPCRVLALDLKGNFPIAVAVSDTYEEILYRTTSDGKTYMASDRAHASPHIENTPDEKFIWIAVYEDDDGTLIPSLPKYSIEDLNEAAKYYSTNLQKELVGRLKVKLERRFDE